VIALVALLALGRADALGAPFDETVRPFLATYCVGCHGADKPKGELDLSAITDLPSATRALPRLEAAAERLSSGEMPPSKARPQPDARIRAQVIDWIRSLRRQQSGRQAGDPGTVLARRLSNAEYDYTIRDLTGVDLRPARQFPVDPANEAGFDNSGESLVMSAPLLKKYLDAARAVADHLVLTPKGLSFAPHPAVTDTDRDEYAVARIVRFYERQPTDLADYFEAAWRFHHRDRPDAPLAAFSGKLAPGYLATVWSALHEPAPVGPLATVQALFAALPPDPRQARIGCEKLRDFVRALRAEVVPPVGNLQLKGVSSGSQPFLLWKDAERARQRTSCPHPPLHVAGERPEVGDRAVEAEAALAMALTHFSFRNIVHDSALPIPFAVHELGATFDPPDPALAIPDEASRPRYEAAFGRFCEVFPDAFYVAQRGRTQLDQPKDRREREERGRLLSAGFHNMFGFFRDDQPLYQRILDAPARRELDELWRELDFITRAPQRQHADFLFYERGESRTLRGPAFDFIRAEDRSAVMPPMIRRLATAYVAMARDSVQATGGDARAIPVLEGFFRDVAANVERVERDRRAAEPAHLAALLAFAQRAYRRPLAESERAGLRRFYRSLREGGMDHESAIRDGVARVLMSPYFLYRLDLVPPGGPHRLDDRALASRLSYFLWSSAPDDRLLARAAAGELHRPEVLAAEARRMLLDPRARALAVEFGGGWLDFRRFEDLNTVDRQHYPGFDAALRQAMFEEPVRFLLDVIQTDRSVLDLLDGHHTFVNAPLARHYGMPVPEGDAWVRVDDARPWGRGGLLPMAAFLTKNAPGLRTSPVKRGYWVVRRLLGEHIPPPPAQVPDLPTDERKMGTLTLREVMARHRENPACAGCHARFDPMGLAFEGYGPVGERRTRDLGGRPIDARASFPGGAEGTGIEGLRDYLRAHRQDEFADNLCRKLLSYALGRTLIPSDDATVDEMRARLGDTHRFTNLVEAIVTSRQFLTRKAQDALARR
jgi:cytochrome c553